MRYLLLLYDDDRALGMTPDEIAEARAAVMPEWLELFAYLDEHARSVDGVELDHPRAAKTLRRRDRDWLVTDGPFAETKEQLGGVFVIELPHLDEAIRLASLVPAAKNGSMEIRPLVDH